MIYYEEIEKTEAHEPKKQMDDEIEEWKTYVLRRCALDVPHQRFSSIPTKRSADQDCQIES